MTHQKPPQSMPAAADACELPLQTRMDVRLMPDTAIAETRTIEVLWSTGAAVRRRDPWSGRVYEEILSLDPSHVDLSRLNGGAPLLNAHDAFDLEDVIGVVERAWIARERSALCSIPFGTTSFPAPRPPLPSCRPPSRWLGMASSR